jgi:hypothetical protein
MTTDRELMQMALDVIKNHTDMNNPQQQAFRNNAIRVLRDRLAQPEYEFECPRCGHCCQQREWVDLTREQIDEMADDGDFLGNIYEITQAIEAKLKEKNT